MVKNIKLLEKRIQHLEHLILECDDSKVTINMHRIEDYLRNNPSPTGKLRTIINNELHLSSTELSSALNKGVRLGLFDKITTTGADRYKLSDNSGINNIPEPSLNNIPTYNNDLSIDDNIKDNGLDVDNDLDDIVIPVSSRNSSLDEIKRTVNKIPGLAGKFFDAAETQVIPKGCIAYFKKMKSVDTTLYFIKKEITAQELSTLANKHSWIITGVYTNPLSKKAFKINYNGLVISCKWSGGPSGASNTEKLTDLKEYATKVALESGFCDYRDNDQIDSVTRFINSKIKRVYPELQLDLKLIKSYAVSAIISAGEFYKQYGLDPKKHSFDRQNFDPRSEAIYNKAKELCVKKIDNWNPGDIWAFANNLSLGQIKSDISRFTSLTELNAYIDRIMGGRENDDLSLMQIIPISLKKVDAKNQFILLEWTLIKLLKLFLIFYKMVLQ